MRNKKPTGLCGFSGCKAPAVWKAHKLWGKGGTICTCEAHKPGSNVARMTIDHANDRVWYRVEPIVAEMTDAELDRLTERCVNGDPDAEEEYERLTRRATARS